MVGRRRRREGPRAWSRGREQYDSRIVDDDDDDDDAIQKETVQRRNVAVHVR